MEQRPALGPGGGGDRLGPGAPGGFVPGFGRQQRRRPWRRSAASSITGVDRARRPAATDRAASARRVRFGFTASQNARRRRCPARPAAPPRRRRAWRAAVLAFSAVKLRRIEMRRRAADLLEGEIRRPAHRSDSARLDGVGGADLGEIGVRAPAARCRPRATARSDSEPRRLDSASPPAPTSSGKCAKCGTARAQRLEDLDLRRGVGDVILAADDVGDGEVDIVDHRRQGVEEAPVLADQHRIGQGARCRSRPGRGSDRAISPCGCESLKRQCGLRPSASSLARSSAVSVSAARS